MKNKKKQSSPVSTSKATGYASFFKQLKRNSSEALVSFRKAPVFLNADFWDELNVVIPDWAELNTGSYNLLLRANDFYEFRLKFNQDIEQLKSEFCGHFPGCTTAELALNAGKLFAIAEFGSVDPESGRVVFSRWNLRMQQALQQLSAAIGSSASTGAPRAMPLNVLFILRSLLHLEHDSLIWNEMMDAWLWGGFNFKAGAKPHEFVLAQPYRDAHRQLAKEKIRRAYRNHYYWGFSKEQVNNDPLIKYAEHKFKVTQGFPASVHSGGIVLNETDSGIVSINADEFPDDSDEFRNMNIEDKSMYIAAQAMLWYSYYHSLRENYWPADDARIHELKIEMPGGNKFSVYKIFAALHFLTAFSESMIGQIATIDLCQKHGVLINNLPKDYPTMSKEEIAFEVDKGILNTAELFPFRLFFVQLEEVKMITMLKNYCLYSEDDARQVLGLLTIKAGNTFEFQPLIFAEGKYYWHTDAFARKAMARYLFEKHWMRQLFSRSNNGVNNAGASLMAENRADGYNELMKELFLLRGFLACTESKTDRMKIDLLAYKDGTLFCIEFKGDNSGIDNFRKRARWKKDNIGGLINQFNKRIAFFNTQEGHEFIDKKFGEKISAKITTIYPLAVAGTFCFEDTILKLESGFQARLISFFTLSTLLRGEEPAAVDSDTWLNIGLRRIKARGNVAVPEELLNPKDQSEATRKKASAFVKEHRMPFWKGDLSATQLIQLIETDFLWSFITENDVRQNVVRENLKTQLLGWES